MKIYLCLLLALAIPAGLSAQEILQAPPPGGPVLLKAGDFAKWTVTVRPLNSDGSDSAATPASQIAPPDSKTSEVVTVTKTLPVRLINQVKSGGQTSVTWCVSGYEILQNSEYTKPTLFSKDSRTFIDYSRSDFPELEWISGKKLVGTKIINGKPCWIFQDKVSFAVSPKNIPGAAKNSPEFFREASVSIQTKLPVLFKDGFNLHTYHFESPPNEPLEVPGDIKALVEHQQQWLQSLARRPPPG